MEDSSIRKAAELIFQSKKIVVFTGAGISTESGIPDFRSPGGVWSKYNQDDLTYQKFRFHERYRKLYWAYDEERYPAMRDAEPNSAHKAIVEIETSNRLKALITQNIDGLHQKSGAPRSKIYELHGTVKEVVCLDCGAKWDREQITGRMKRERIEVPYCELCGGPLKCATIAFGQELKQDTLSASFAHAASCDLFLTIGSSLVVQPAALLPAQAKKTGARLILVNLSPTPYDRIMDVIVTGKASETMSKIMSVFRQLK